MCINVFIDRERQILSLLYSICEGLNSFFSSRDPEENVFDGQKETASITTFKKSPFANDFKIESEDEKVLSVLCNIAPKWNTMISYERQGLETLKALP